MRIGINGSTHIAMASPSKAIIDHAAEAEADGLSSYWVAQLAVPDALTLLAVMGDATSTIELGTAVIPTWTRHPLMLAAQALTTQEFVGGRLALGIGLAHKVPVEATLKIPFERPARNMEEYLSILVPALQDRKVNYEGDIWSAEVDAVGGPPGVGAPSVLVAAMGPRMLALAGSRTDGTILWLSGPKAIEDHVAPKIRAAAEEAGRSAPRIIASVPICVTDDPDRVRGMVDVVLAGYNDLPSYRDVMDREGAAGPGAVSIIGDEDTCRAELTRFADAGATDFSALEFTTNDDEVGRTRTLLREVNPD